MARVNRVSYDPSRKKGNALIPTSQDVADRAGVSRSTVSQILNGFADKFNDATRDRVLQAVTELGYQPSAAGRTLARGSSDIVIALIPNTTFGSNLQDIYGALTEELASRGLTLVLRLSNDNLDSLDRLVVGMKPRAVLTLTPLTDDQRNLLVGRDVEVLEPGSEPNADANAQIGALQAQYLIGRGYRQLAYAHLRDARNDPFGEPRERLFRVECLAAGLDEPRVLNVEISPEGARVALDELGQPGFAIGCYNDDVATALLYAAKERGWSTPGNLALIGMDNTLLSRVTTPPLTTMGFDAKQVIDASVESLLARLDKREPLQPQVELRLNLIERESA